MTNSLAGLSAQERNTVVAALAYYLDGGQGSPDMRPATIHAFACGEHPALQECCSLDQAGIAALLQKVVGF